MRWISISLPSSGKVRQGESALGTTCFALLCRASPPEADLPLARLATTSILLLVSFFLLSSTALAEEQSIKELDRALTHIKESYYGTIDMESLVDSTLQSVLDSLDKDSKVVKGVPPSLDFVRGLEEETSVTEARLATAEIAYVKIGFFGRRTGAHFQKALESLGCGSATPPDGPRVKGLMLDLRDNPGGYLQSALEVLRYFVLPGKTLLIEKTRGGERPHLSDGGTPLQLPIVILINGSTASSAEIVAAALRYHCGARVVGEKSKGKGTIQEVIPLGTRTLILTVGEYLLPDGSSLRDKGILPDLEVKGHEEQLQAALSLMAVGGRQ